MQVPPFSLNEQLSQIGQDLDTAVAKTLRSGQYIGGQQVELFEKSFSETINVPYTVSCNSGTDALVLALRALDIGPGDEVISVSFSFFATAEAISNVGAKPIFIDVNSNDFLINPNLIEDAITSSTKAILPVHLFGNPVNMDAIMSIAKKHGLKVIEDCAQAAGSYWKGKSLGSIGDIGCFSFFPTKNLGAAGDGGAVTTKSLELARRMRDLSIHGMPKRYFHTELGYNSRLDALQAAVLNVKLPLLSSWVEQRRKIALNYIKNLQDLSGIELPKDSSVNGTINSWNQFVIKVKNYDINKDSLREEFIAIPNQVRTYLPDSRCRDLLRQNLSDKGINTIIYYPIPIHLQPAYSQLKGKSHSLINSELLCSQVLSLPIFPELSIEKQDYVVQSIKELINCQ